MVLCLQFDLKGLDSLPTFAYGFKLCHLLFCKLGHFFRRVKTCSFKFSWRQDVHKIQLTLVALLPNRKCRVIELMSHTVRFCTRFSSLSSLLPSKQKQVSLTCFMSKSSRNCQRRVSVFIFCINVSP